MTAGPAAAEASHDDARDRRATTESGRALRWWRELIYIALFYLAYTAVRNTFGSGVGGSEAGTGTEAVRTAFEHARTIIDAQQALGLWFEPELQRWYLDLPARGGIRAWNIFYGTAHFVVTILALVLLFVRDPDRYPRWRNTLAAMTALALVGFATWSLMPPRLLDEGAPYGACRVSESACARYDIVDTLVTDGGLWSFESGAMADVSNQYAAMPSLHTAWSVWAALVLLPLTRRRWLRALIVAHPVATVFGILITGNHFWLDAVGGLAVLGAGWLVGSRVADLVETRHVRRRG